MGVLANDLSLKVSVLNWQEGTLQTEISFTNPDTNRKSTPISVWKSKSYS